MGKKSFFTEQFYANPTLTLEILNKLVEGNYVADRDMIQHGTYLFMEVFENDETKEILSQVVSDLTAYKKYNAETFIADEETEISLCALQDEHSRFFGIGENIVWNPIFKEFEI